MSLCLTKIAAQRVKDFLVNRKKSIGIRVAVKTTGCSGLAYKLEFVEKANPDDEIFESLGVKIFVDKNSFKYVDGTQLDYVKEGLQEGFKFVNPNVKETCGCGESFTV